MSIFYNIASMSSVSLYTQIFRLETDLGDYGGLYGFNQVEWRYYVSCYFDSSLTYAIHVSSPVKWLTPLLLQILTILLIM